MLFFSTRTLQDAPTSSSQGKCERLLTHISLEKSPLSLSFSAEHETRRPSPRARPYTSLSLLQCGARNRRRRELVRTFLSHPFHAEHETRRPSSRARPHLSLFPFQCGARNSTPVVESSSTSLPLLFPPLSPECRNLYRDSYRR